MKISLESVNLMKAIRRMTFTQTCIKDIHKDGFYFRYHGDMHDSIRDTQYMLQPLPALIFSLKREPTV
ncbi:hypothetical protein HOLleu_22151 [Holothuria leucospilota]|uniref:Uncharacterized protein n=1 Tax=Holothuria leucospilota TaxID=206669 RepID=A0A9Q1BYR4_HOLLE|nr:hypothetical protein HOLleu_22151 [Holothuria leucospilota]